MESPRLVERPCLKVAIHAIFGQPTITQDQLNQWLVRHANRASAGGPGQGGPGGPQGQPGPPQQQQQQQSAGSWRCSGGSSGFWGNLTVLKGILNVNDF